MNMRKACNWFISILTITSLIPSELCGQHLSQSGPVVDIRSMLPGQVAKLAFWPTTEQRFGKVVKSNASKWAIRVSRNSIEWVRKVIDPEWLPDNPEKTLRSELVLLEKAYDGLDTSHIEWEKNGYCLRVSQTKTVFCLSIMPVHGKIVGGDMAAKRKASQGIVSKLVNDIAEVRTAIKPGGANIAIGGTKTILMRSSFEEASIKQFDHGIVARPAKIDINNELDDVRTDFWWRRMGWWTDGQTVGIFAPKAEGGAWVAHYGSELDKYWLSPPPLEWSR